MSDLDRGQSDLAVSGLADFCLSLRYAFGMKLHNYFCSSASYRVRIALNLKGLDYDCVSVQLARGDHKKPPYVELSADTWVPLLPADVLGRAKVRALAQSIACGDIHPLTNLHAYEACMALPAFKLAELAACLDSE
jgi:hypothetical protein